MGNSPCSNLWSVSCNCWECRNRAFNKLPITADLSVTLSLDRIISAECMS